MSGPVARNPTVVLDTGIVCAAAFNPVGVSEKVVRLMVGAEIPVVMSNRLRHEYEQTLTNPALSRRYPFLTSDYIAAFLDRFDTHAERIPNPLQVIAYARDPNDEPLINLAVAVRADYLVTLDGDLLDLPRRPEFASLPHQPRILRPGAFLTEWEQRAASATE